MACLNLPLDIRYQTENMYLVGIVPGPSEPLSNDLNHYMRPVLKDMAGAWEQGIFFSRTPSFPNGRDTRSAIAAVVNDLPAARKAAALAPHNSHFYCSKCGCWHISTRGCTNYHEWKTRDYREMRRQAEAWRDAKTEKAQTTIFQKHGIRWSELWRLPYWDPTRQLVVDSMHCMLEGLGEHHARDVLGLSTASAMANPIVMPPFTQAFRAVDKNVTKLKECEIKHVTEIQALLTAPVEGGDIENLVEENLQKLDKKLMSKNLGPLKFVSTDLKLRVMPRERSSARFRPDGEPILQKADYVKALLEWRRSKPLEAEDQSLKIVTPEVMQHIKAVIRDTITPSWLNTVPYNFGDKKAGTLKADEWRTMYTVYLPIALVSLWGEGTSHCSAAVSAKLREILDHTMSLVSAITIVCMRTMTATRARAYRHHVAKWVRDLSRLHPNIAQRTNNHMAIHIYDFLILFGPVRSWWCFPFERLIGYLQRLSHNHKFGQLESTLLQSFIRAAKLRRWLARSDCPPIIKECKKLFDKLYGSTRDKYEVPVNNELNMAEKECTDRRGVVVPSDLRRLIKGPRVVLRARHNYCGTVYARSSTHLGNSLIEFCPAGNRACSPVPGCIKYIILNPDKPIFAVQRHLNVPQGTVDPFAPYPDFPAKLYSALLSDDLELVEADWVVSHFARWAISSECVVVLSLSKVKIYLFHHIALD
ncbi:hypothetical protein BD410DRAFT_735121 [Rickenella mellea]|uniref:Uncharacterized protein n=1 Tax=Rickenella mellea TaxID=50990 RepID=A0A4Y7PE23_9AGAM|nr:hypothetical protein BD410DRAFT_735121 [Rickenella mellea]